MATQIIVCSIGIIILVVIFIFMIRGARPAKGPMYLKYVQPDGTFREPRFTRAERLGEKEPVCPICRMPFRLINYTGFDYVICSKCSKEISARGEDFRPEFITDDRDWLYLKNCRSAIFWIINSDYEHGDIGADRARKLMHKLVPEGYGEFPLIRYRESRNYIKSQQSHLDSTFNRYCLVCNSYNSCKCEQMYVEALRVGKCYKELEPNLNKLRKLNPPFTIDGYYKKNGRVFARRKQQTRFRIEDYFTFDDWQAVQYILNQALQPEYTECAIREARAQYMKLINTDLEILVEFYTAIARGESLTIPLLPSTNPDNIKEIEEAGPRESTYDKLMKEFSK